MTWFMDILTAAGTSIIVCLVMEKYFVRRALDELGENDEGLE